eukprot:TRINITY_DN82143_c0_g1_i1.p1 TRINITY_DN82143_c0_g1~~TRINITY_DN82143_c0_g1_i1.p1  ORF type:complete len:418 (-),score=55.16 TRINITY_DN82143_c0_g1_i1:130-1230(-)
MTDGNHGRAVAHIAHKMGCKCVIYVPEIMAEARREAIRKEGAEVIVVEGSYDDSIATVRAKCEGPDQWCLISDVGWPGYEDVPGDICCGYGTIFREVEEEMLKGISNMTKSEEHESANNFKPITHLFLQAGVGGFASAGVCYAYWNSKRWRKPGSDSSDLKDVVWSKDLKIICVEPSDADCILENAKYCFQSGKAVSESLAGTDSANSSNSSTEKQRVDCLSFLSDLVKLVVSSCTLRTKSSPERKIDPESGLAISHGRTESIMQGLNCGVPSTTAWPVLRDLCDGYLAVGDRYAKDAVRFLKEEEDVVSGESGCAGIAGVMAAMGSEKNLSLSDLGLGEDSVILFVSTESDTDPDVYGKIIRGEC